MKYRYLGRSGLLVSRVCLGTMAFGNPEWGCEQDVASEMVQRFIEAGGNFFDTADMYSGGRSEEMLGKAIEPFDRDDLVVATKCWFRMGPTPNAKGLSRKHIFEAVEASLRRMNTDYIDLFQVHGPDWFTPMEETVRALGDLVRSGKVRYVGCSNYYAWQLVKSNALAASMNLDGFISGQYMYNLVRRDIEREIMPACADQGMGILCWSPLASGFLSGRYHRDTEPPQGSRISYRKNIDIPRYYSDEAFDLIDELRAVAEETSKSPAQVALAWLLHNRIVTSVLIGPRYTKHMEENMMVGDWNLDDDHNQRLTNALPLPHGYPSDWVELGYGNVAGNEEFPPKHFRHYLDQS